VRGRRIRGTFGVLGDSSKHSLADHLLDPCCSSTASTQTPQRFPNATKLLLLLLQLLLISQPSNLKQGRDPEEDRVEEHENLTQRSQQLEHMADEKRKKKKKMMMMMH